MVIVGTRPEIVKMAPIIRALKKEAMPFTFVHCGQHYDYNMSQQFIEDLELQAPDFSFKLRAASPGEQTARIMMRISSGQSLQLFWSRATQTRCLQLL